MAEGAGTVALLPFSSGVNIYAHMQPLNTHTCAASVVSRSLAAASSASFCRLTFFLASSSASRFRSVSGSEAPLPFFVQNGPWPRRALGLSKSLRQPRHENIGKSEIWGGDQRGPTSGGEKASDCKIVTIDRDISADRDHMTPGLFASSARRALTPTLNPVLPSPGLPLLRKQ